MSEPVTSTPSKGNKARRWRLSALCPAVFATVAFALQLTAVLSGMHVGQSEQFSLMTLNTSQLGQNLIDFEPTTDTSVAVVAKFNPLDPFGLLPTSTTGIVASITSAAGGVTSTLGSEASSVTSAIASVITSEASAIPSKVSSVIASATIPSILGGSSAASSNGTDTLTSIFDDIGTFLSGALTNITTGVTSGLTSTVDDTLNSAESALVDKVTEELGLQDFYSLYLTSVCYGNYSSDTSSSATATVSACSSYSSVLYGLTDSSLTTIPSSFTILTTNISIPALTLIPIALADLKSITSFISVLSKIFHIISLLGVGLTAILSFLAIIIRSHLLIRIIALTSLLGSGFQTLSAILFTVIATAVPHYLNRYGNVLGLYASHGSAFLAITWVAFVLALWAGLYWETVYLVEVRKTSFRRRWRSVGEVGNYWGLWWEIKRDLRKPKAGEDGMEEGLLGKGKDAAVERRVKITREKGEGDEEGTFVYKVTADGGAKPKSPAHNSLYDA